MQLWAQLLRLKGILTRLVKQSLGIANPKIYMKITNHEIGFDGTCFLITLQKRYITATPLYQRH